MRLISAVCIPVSIRKMGSAGGEPAKPAAAQQSEVRSPNNVKRTRTRMGSSTQIIPVACGRNRVALHAQALLRSEGLLVAAVRPPTVPQGAARLRLSLRADLTEEDLKRVRLGFSRLRVSFFPCAAGPFRTA